MNKLTLTDAQKWILSFPSSAASGGVSCSSAEKQYQARLICFHWAGGNGQIFRTWNKYLSNRIHVTAMGLPGRLSRSSERIPTDIHEIVG